MTKFEKENKQQLSFHNKITVHLAKCVTTAGTHDPYCPLNQL